MRGILFPSSDMPERDTWQHRARALLSNPAARLFRVWQRHWLERSTIRTLHRLDDRTLKDIGLDRCEIESAVAELDRERRPGSLARRRASVADARVLRPTLPDCRT